MDLSGKMKLEGCSTSIPVYLDIRNSRNALVCIGSDSVVNYSAVFEIGTKMSCGRK